MNIYLVGNALLEVDALPLQIKPDLQKEFPEIQFIEFDPTEDWPDDPYPIFIDTVINLTEPRLFTSIDAFEAVATREMSVHNFDFYAELKLRQKIGLTKKYFIIGIPPQIDMTRCRALLAKMIRQLLT